VCYLAAVLASRVRDCGLVGDAASTKPCPETVRLHPEWFVCRQNQGDDVPLLGPLRPNFTSVTYPCTPKKAAMEYSSHLCWSLPSVHSALASGIRRVLAASPSIQYAAIDIMDGFATPCPADMPAVKESGSFAGPALAAVSAVAALLEPDFPDVKLRTIAYHREATLIPPTRGHLYTNGLHKNVVVQYCMSYEDNSAGLMEPANNQTLDHIRAYVKLAAKSGVWVWAYMGNIGFPLAPYPYYAAVAEDIAHLAKEGVSGYFGQAASAGGADMTELRAYLMGRKTLDPSLPTDMLVHEFLWGFYGPSAAPFVLKYMTIMSKAAKALAPRMYHGHHTTKDYSPSSPLFSNETVVAAAAAMASAAKALAVDDEEHRVRVLRSSLAINYIVLLRWQDYFSFVKTQRRAWPLATSDKRQFFAQFVAACNHTVHSINVPTCAGWVNGPGPSGRECWKMGGNLTEFENFLFPAVKTNGWSTASRWKTDEALNRSSARARESPRPWVNSASGVHTVLIGDEDMTDADVRHAAASGAAPDFVWGGSATHTRTWRQAAPNVVLTRYVAFAHDPTCTHYTGCTDGNLTWWRKTHPTHG
jgi:hypothetical protein